MRGDAAQAEFAACVRCDPVLALRLRLHPVDFGTQQDLLRALLLAAPVASGAAQVTYAARWRQSVGVAHLAQALAVRSGVADAEAAWTAGLAHNLADYLDTDITPPAHAADWLAELDPDGWLADAVRYHAEPLVRGRAAHPLVRIVQLAYQLVTRADAVDSVDVRAALAALQLGAGEAAQLLADSSGAGAPAGAALRADRCGGADEWRGIRSSRPPVCGAGGAIGAARPFPPGTRGRPGVCPAAGRLRALFGIERACLFAPAADGTPAGDAADSRGLRPHRAGDSARRRPFGAAARAGAQRAPAVRARRDGCGAGRRTDRPPARGVALFSASRWR